MILKFLLEEEQRQRRSDLTYTEKKVKEKLDRVIVELKGNESGALTRLTSRYDRLDKAIKVMGQKRDELNDQIKTEAEELFAAEDEVLTRVIETVSFTLTISKREKQDDKVSIDYEAIAKELAVLLGKELEPKVKEIYEAYTTVTKRPDKSPALRVKSKIEEGLIQSTINLIKKLVDGIKDWGKKYDKRLDDLKKLAKTSTVKESFVSRLDSLKIDDLQPLVDFKLLHSKFIRLNGPEAEYYIASKDDNENMFLVNVLTVVHKLGEGYKLEDISPVPEEEFERLADAKRYIDSK